MAWKRTRVKAQLGQVIIKGHRVLVTAEDRKGTVEKVTRSRQVIVVMDDSGEAEAFCGGDLLIKVGI